MLLATVSLNRKVSWATMAMRRRRLARVTPRMSWPSMRTAPVDVIEAGEQGGEGGFAGAAGADEGDDFAAFDAEVEIATDGEALGGVGVAEGCVEGDGLAKAGERGPRGVP
jgi:hypothetical protein